MKELAGPVSVPNLDIANKVSELNIKRDLGIEYVDADGNALTNEPIALRVSSGASQNVSLGGSGKAIIKDAPLGRLDR